MPTVEFRVHGASQELGEDAAIPDGWTVATTIIKGRERRYAVTPEPFLTEAHVLQMAPTPNEGVVTVALTAEGASHLKDYTGNHVRERVGIRFNGRWVCFPMVMVQIPGGRMPMLNLTEAEVELALSAWPDR